MVRRGASGSGKSKKVNITKSAAISIRRTGLIKEIIFRLPA